MDPSTPVLLIRRGDLLVHALPDVARANISFISGVSSIYGVSIIIGFVSKGKTETSLMVGQLNNCWSKITLLVWLTVSGSLIRSPCVSLVVAIFNSYKALFIVKLLIASTRS